MSEPCYFTRKGIEKLRLEIQQLTERLEGLQAQTAHVAEVGGDQYHDNSSYELLTIDIRGIDRRLSEAHRLMNRATVIDPPATFDRVAITTRVTIRSGGLEKKTWQIVGYGESEPKEGKIAYNAPLAKLIIGKKIGDVVVDKLGGKEVEIEIVSIEKGDV